MFRIGDTLSARPKVLAARSQKQKADPAYWQAGDLIMISCYVRIGDIPHPDSGRIVRIVQTGGRRDNDNLMVQTMEGNLEKCIEGDMAEINKYILMPRLAFRPVPPSCIEAYPTKLGAQAWRLSKQGVQIFREMKWAYAPPSLGQ